MKKKQATFNNRIIAERLEPRVLFSADPLSLSVGALLLDEQDTFDTPAPFEPFSEINIASPEADHAPTPVELIFIDIRADSSREDIQNILAQERGNAIVHLIDSQTGGIDSVSSIIAQHDAVSSVHFLVHGDNQGLRIGADWLDVDSINGFNNQLSSWAQYLTEDADVLLYGCDLTAGTDGLSLIEQLATLTGADVAASEDKTGHESRDANWVLEHSTGTIETASLGAGSVGQDWVGVLDLILVSTNADIIDGDTSSIAALQLDMGTDGAISLREAIIAANNTTGIDEIQLEDDDYDLSAGADEDSAATGDLDILEGVVISGVSSADTTIDAGDNDRVFDIFATDVTIENLSTDNSTVVGNGGAIQIHSGTTRLDSVVVDHSVASEAGGNIYISSGNLIIDNSNIRHGDAGTDGGGIAVTGTANIDITNTIIHHSVAGGNGAGLALLGSGDATINHTYFHRNVTTTGDGGGLFDATGGSLTITNTTFVINEAVQGGGAYLDGDTQLSNTTFSDNTASSDGGGLYLASGTATIQNNTFTKNQVSSNGDPTVGDAIKISAGASATIGNTIIAENDNDARPEVVGTVVSTGFNLLSDNDPAFDAITDILAGDANLDNIPEIADESLIGTGNVPTHSPQAGSDAIDTGGARTGIDVNGFMANTFSDIGVVEADPAATGKKIFWADSDGWIYRANEDGSGVQQIFQTDNPPGDIEYDPGTGRIFWSETDGQWGSLRSTDINGNDLQHITSSSIGDRLMSPTGIAIDATGRFLYVHADYEISPANGAFGKTNTIDRYTINNDGSLTFESEIYAGSPFSNPDPQLSQAIELEYTSNLNGREALIWNDAGNNGIGLIPETVPQINIWDLTPSPNTYPNFSIVPTPTGTFDPRGIAVDTTTGVVYFSTVDNDVVGITVDLDTQDTTDFDAADDEFLFGLEYDDSTDTLWWTEFDGTTGNIGTFGGNLNSYNYLITYSGAPIAVALADITPVSASPVATEDAYTIDEGGTLADATASVLDNDTDVDGPAPLSASLVSGPTNAAAFTLNSDGTFSYTHNDSDTTTDSFTYTANDAATGVSAVTTVALTITPVNDNDPVAVADAYTLAEGATLAHATNSVLDNDTDADAPNDTITASLVSGPTNAAAFTLNSDGTFSYTHNDSDTTTDSFTYTANDAATGVSAVTTVALTITPVNDNDPVAVADAYTLAEGATLAHATNSVLDNDTDADAPNDTITATLVSGPTNAAAFTLNSDGTFSYTHNDSDTTTDSFTYTANDAATGVSAVTTVALTITPVNDNDPVAVADAYTLAEGATLAHATNSVLDNDTDADTPNDTITATLVSGPTNAAAFTLNSDGTFSYTHNDSDTTTDSFTYTANDAATGVSAVTTVALTITPVNDNDPVAVADAYTLAEGATLAHATNSVLDNDTDADAPNDTITATLVSGPTNAAAFTLNSDGTFSYTHNGSETTSDSFTYTANDAVGHSSTATVLITVTPINDLPEGVNDTFGVLEGTPFIADVLANDSDPDGDTLSAVLGIGPSHGSVTLNPDNTFTYVYDGSAETADSFTYVATDGTGNSLATTVTLNITGTNDAPQAVADNFVTFEGIPFTGTVLSNDTDEDGDSLTPSTVVSPIFGSLVWNTDNTFTYAHDGTENFTDSFTYIVTDGVSDSAPTTVTINVTPVNDAPIAVDDADNVDEGGLSSMLVGNVSSILANDSDPENENLSARIVEGPSHGILSLDPNTGTFIYEHDGSETTQDSYTYAATDASGATSEATVTITVKEINDDPVAEDDEYLVSEGGLLAHTSASVLDNDTDAENDALTAELIGAGPANALSFELFANGTFSYRHDGSETTTDSFTYVAKDTRTGESTVTSVNIIITEADDAPIGVDDTYNVDEGGLLNHPTASVLDNDTDAENNVLTVELVNGPSNSTAFSVLANGQFSYQHDGSETTQDTFSYIAKDQNNVSTEVDVTITINPINDIPVPVSSTATELSVPGTAALILPDNLFIDAEGEPLVYSVIEHTDENNITMPGLPGWLEFKPEDSSFNVTDQESATSISVVIVATDPNNGTSEHKTIDLVFAPRLGAVTTDELDMPEAVTNTPVVEELIEETVEPKPTAVTNQADIISSEKISITEAIDFEHIDIASLIKPLPTIAAEGASATAQLLAGLAESMADDAIQTNNIEQLTFELLSNESFNRGLDSLADSFDEQNELLEEAYTQSRTAIGRSITLTSGLSVGYLIWLIRGGTLMGSVLSSMPAWRLVDPLPILGSMGDDFGESDDSLESMVENTE